MLVATAVLAVGLVAIATGFQYATSGVAVGGGESTAVFLAEQRVEQLRADAMSDFSAPSLGPGTTTEYCAPAIIAGRTSTCQDTAGAGASYVRRTTISDVTGSMGCPARPVWCKQIEVRVGYRPVTSTGELNQARAIDVITEHPEGDQTVELRQPGDTSVVGRGLWHRSVLLEPSNRIFMVAGAGTKMRPV